MLMNNIFKQDHLVNQSRRAMALGLILFPMASFSNSEKPLITMWKSPTCGCCKDWANYVEKNGFRVISHLTGNEGMRQKLGMPLKYGSCHTALIQGYVIEGHVPVREIRRLIAEKPKALGLTVPAMPIGSPGMDGPEYRGRKDPYDVLLIAASGKPMIYQSYR